jgi:hypothetical protein
MTEESLAFESLGAINSLEEQSAAVSPLRRIYLG